jgi:hypothetical protein
MCIVLSLAAQKFPSCRSRLGALIRRYHISGISTVNVGLARTARFCALQVKTLAIPQKAALPEASLRICALRFWLCAFFQWHVPPFPGDLEK